MDKSTKKKLPRLPSYRFSYESSGGYNRISYADVLNPNGTPKPGVEILGVNAEMDQEIMVRMPDGLEVFFHWRGEESE